MFEFSRSLRHWINDGFMTLFFFVVALELKREIVLGELRHVRTAALSFAGALGGMLVPACVFLALMRGQAGMNGWGTVTATDAAFAIGCLALLGSRIPPSLRLFILSLAIFDDIGAILVVAFGYGEAVHRLLQEHTVSEDNPYREWFAFHGDPKHRESAKKAYALLDRQAALSTEAQRARMAEIFMISVRHETMLWDEYYDRVEWETYPEGEA